MSQAALEPQECAHSETPVQSLVSRTIRGAGWMIGWRLATRCLGLVSTSILARLLTPADFGLVALAYTFARGIDAVAAFNIDLVLLRERKFDERLYSTGMSVSVMRSLLMAGIVIVFAKSFSTFFGDIRLMPILLCFAVGLVIEGAENLGALEFRRNLQFGYDFLMFGIPRTVGVIGAIAVAIVFQSYWAMVIGILLFKLTRTIVSYVLHPFRFKFTFVEWRRLFALSVWLWANSLAGFLRDRCDTLIIGRGLNAASVGLFSAAVEIAILPITEIVEPLGRALFSGMSAAYHNGVDVAGAVSRSVAAMACLALPAGIGLSLVAGPLIRITLGLNWSAGYEIVQIIAPFAVFWVFSSVSNIALIVLGHPKLTTLGTTSLVLLRVPLMIAGLKFYGLTGLAWAFAIGYPLECAFYTIVLRRIAQLGICSLGRQLWRSVTAVSVMAGIMVMLGAGGTTPTTSISVAFLQLAYGIAVGGVTYPAVLFLLWRSGGYQSGPEALIMAQAHQVYRRIKNRVRCGCGEERTSTKEFQYEGR